MYILYIANFDFDDLTVAALAALAPPITANITSYTVMKFIVYCRHFPSLTGELRKSHFCCLKNVISQNTFLCLCTVEGLNKFMLSNQPGHACSTEEGPLFIRKELTRQNA